jgi:predicted transcriptional regulator
VARIRGAPTADSARLMGVLTTKVVTHRLSTSGPDPRDMIADGQELTS